jgi:hypothetical protein
VKLLPDIKAVPGARKYPGEILNMERSAAAFSGLRADVLSVKTCESSVPIA